MKVFFSVFLFCASVGLSIQGYKVVCYYTYWSFLRSNGSYYPSDINQKLCTHINYAFATLDETDLIMKPRDPWVDITNNLYADVVAFKQYGIKVLISIGGWGDSAGDKWSKFVSNSSARANFNKNAIVFLKKYGFDGIDIFWEYPKCWQADCNAGPNSDKTNFATWIKELKTLFNSKNVKSNGYLLSAAVASDIYIASNAYDVKTLSANLDHINLMTYYYHGTWDTTTGHNSPLYAAPSDDPTLNSNYSVNYWISLGADPKKIVMGIPFFGNSYTLKDARKNGLNAPVTGGGAPGDITGSSGFLAFSEICYHIAYDGWTIVKDTTGSMGPYAYKGKQWVAYDDIDSVVMKCHYIAYTGLGGAMVWTLDVDDFQNRCDCDVHPLLRTIYRVLTYPEAFTNCPHIGYKRPY